MENYSQNNSNEISVSTKGTTFYGDTDKMKTPCCLEIGWWNNMISVIFTPTLSNPTENKKYDYEKSVLTSLPNDKVFTLYNALVKLEESGKDGNVGVQVGADGLLVVSINGNDRTISLYKGIDNNTKKPKNEITFEFTSNNAIVDYDKEDGSYNTLSVSAFELFKVVLKNSIVYLLNGTAHNIRQVEKYANRRLMATINNIAEKTGAESLVGGVKGQYSQRNKVDWGGSSKSSSSNTQVDDIDDLDEVPF